MCEYHYLYTQKKILLGLKKSMPLEGIASIPGVLQAKFEVFILRLGVWKGTPRHIFRTLLLFGLLVQNKDLLLHRKKLI